jgi:quinone-reactive Ni/Fe-hydrogenase small subunit
MAIDRRALFAGAMGPTGPPVGIGYDPALLLRSEERLAELEAMRPLSGLNLKKLLADNGISRRTFLKWVSATTALLMLPPRFEPLVARAAALTNRIPVIWIEAQSCTGNSEALLRAAGPTIDELIFNVISLEYADVLMAASGFQAEQRLQDTIKAYGGKYILIVEGSIPQGLNGTYGTIGPSGTTFLERVQKTADGAAAVIAVGACAFYGGVGGASPNPTGAVGVSDVVKGKPIVNIPACPMNPANLMGTILHYALTGNVPALDNLLRPTFAFGYRVHDNCERRAHFDAGEYVQQWGDLGARNNFCLYKMGCKGPMTYNNCSIIRYNEGVNWPIGAGHGCIGCSELDFWDRYAYERPLANADISAPGLFGFGVEGSVDRFGVGLLTAAAAGIALHAVLTGAAARRRAAAAPTGDGGETKPGEPGAPQAAKGDGKS